MSEGQADPAARLEELELEEKTISRKRRQLHRRIEFLHGTGTFEPGAKELLADLTGEEKALSAKRRRLHVEIDLLRRSIE